MGQLSSLLKGCVLHIPLDPDGYNPTTRRFTDKSAFGNHGTSGNAAGFTADRMGQANKAMLFNGSGDHIPCGDLGLIGDPAPFTVSAWWCQTSSALHPLRSYVASVLDIVTPSAGATFAPCNETEIRVMYGRRGTSYSTFTLPQTYNHNQWYHTMLTYDGTNIATYFNNQEINSRPKDIPVSNLSHIGRSSTLNSHYFTGHIADVWVHNRVLSESERTFLYESYNPRRIT